MWDGGNVYFDSAANSHASTNTNSRTYGNRRAYCGTHAVTPAVTDTDCNLGPHSYAHTDANPAAKANIDVCHPSRSHRRNPCIGHPGAQRR